MVEAMQLSFTTEQTLGLAPDYGTQRAGRMLIPLTDWSCSGYDNDLLWAEFPDPKSPPARTIFSFSSLRGRCSCASAKFPCRHLIALLLHYIEQPTPLTKYNVPIWVSERFLANPQSPISSLSSPDVHRLTTITAGLLELERWLKDLVHQGLATAAQRPKRFWLDAADRLVDAYAEPLARDVRELALLPGQGRDWPERLLARLGLLYLFVQGFKGYDGLSAAAQGDLRLAIGWQPHELPTDPSAFVADHWLVLGRRIELADRQRQQRLWLWGIESGRFALLADTLPLKRNESLCLPTDMVLETSLAFYPSNWPVVAGMTADGRPLTAVVGQPSTVNGQRSAIGGHSTIEQGIRAYAQARTANPWLRTFPLALNEVRVERIQSGWRLRDEAGSVLALPPRFNQGWQLLSLSAAEPLSLFGEWNGLYLLPLSVYRDGRWLDLHRWRGVA
jgi:hypothetical protein